MATKTISLGSFSDVGALGAYARKKCFPITESTINSYIPPFSTISDVKLEGKVQNIEYGATQISGTTYGTYRSYNETRDNWLTGGTYVVEENTYSSAGYLSSSESLDKIVSFSKSIKTNQTDFQSGTANAGKLKITGNAIGESHATATTGVGVYLQFGDNTEVLMSNINAVYTITLPTVKLNILNGYGKFNSTSSTVDINSNFTPVVDDLTKYRVVSWTRVKKTSSETARVYTQPSLTFQANTTMLNGTTTTYDVEFTPVYRVTCDLKGGSGQAESFYYDKDGIWIPSENKSGTKGNITLSQPSRWGYTFTGWKNISTGVISSNVTINVGTSKENLAYEAQWKPNTYKVTFETMTYDSLDSSKKLYSANDACEVSLILEGEIQPSGTTSIFVEYEKYYGLDITLSNVNKYIFKEIQEYHIPENNIKGTYTMGDVQQRQMTGEIHKDTVEIKYVIIFEKQSYSFNTINCYIYDQQGIAQSTQEKCYLLEVNGSPFIDKEKSKYLYDNEVTLYLTPNFEYELQDWSATSNRTITSTSSKITNFIFKESNSINIYLREKKLDESSIPENIEDGNSPEVIRVTDSILNRSIEKFVDNSTKLKRVGPYAFYNCGNLRTIFLKHCDTISGYAFGNCRNLVTFKMPLHAGYSSRKIEAKAFDGCQNLSTVIIPGNDKVQLVDIDAFTGTLLDANNLIDGVGFIYVNDPDQYIGIINGDTNWGVFANHFRKIADYPEICGEVIQ